MSARSFTSQKELAEAIESGELAVAVAERRVDRLIRTAFRDGDVAARAFASLRQSKGDEAAVSMAEGKGDGLPRVMWYGRQRGGLLNQAARRESNAAIAELREAADDWRTKSTLLKDLRGLRAHHERDAGRKDDTDQERTPPRGGGRGR